MISALRATPLALALLLAGCAVGPDYHAPDLGLPAQYRAAPETVATPKPSADTPWWRSFGDPQLDALETAAMAQNLDLAQAVARLDQARGAARVAGAARLPAGQAALQAAHVRQSVGNSVGEIEKIFPQFQRENNVFDANIGASWELDLFGGLGRNAEAARAELDAAHAGVAAARLMVSTEVAEAYVRLRGFQQRQLLLDRQITLLRDTEKLVRLKVDQGVAAQRDLDAARADLAQAEALDPALRVAMEAELERLAVLTGRPPETPLGDLAQTAPVPRPAPGLAGAPGDLLRRRPDLIVAERRLVAANARIGAAISDYYPKVSLQSLLGSEALATGDLFTGNTNLSQTTLGLRWRLFDFGRVSAEVAVARGREAEALAAYRQAVLRAAAEVEAALGSRLQTAEQARRYQGALADLTHRRTATADAYAAGGASLLELLDADRQRLAFEDQLVQAQVGQALAEVSLARGIGGGAGPT